LKDSWNETEIRAAAQAHGILEHDDHWRRTLPEAADIQCRRQLRHLFTVVLVFGMPDEPENVKTKLSTTLPTNGRSATYSILSTAPRVS